MKRGGVRRRGSVVAKRVRLCQSVGVIAGTSEALGTASRRTQAAIAAAAAAVVRAGGPAPAAV